MKICPPALAALVLLAFPPTAFARYSSGASGPPVPFGPALGPAAAAAVGPVLGRGLGPDFGRAGSLRDRPLNRPELVPPGAELMLFGASPQLVVGTGVGILAELLEGRVEAPDRSGRLTVELGRNGTRKRLAWRQSHQLTLETGEVEVELLFYFKQGSWYVSSAERRVGRVLGETIEFFDADLDGRFTGAADFMRVGDDAFAPCGEGLLAASDDRLMWVSVDAEERRVELRDVATPEWALDHQLRGLEAVNAVRSAAGIGPVLLDEDRSRGCLAHVEYLVLNHVESSQGVEAMHSQRPSAPGYSSEGHRAAQSSCVGFLPDPRDTVEEHLRTLLHRGHLLGDFGEGLGFGVADATRDATVSGYSVLWGGLPEVAAPATPVFYPGPGQVDVITTAMPEFPRIEQDPNHYDRPRGLPIAVYFGTHEFEQSTLELFRVGRGGDGGVDGLGFSPESPVHSYLSGNQDAAFFLPAEPLEVNTSYRAVLRARRAGEPDWAVVAWTFETARRHPSDTVAFGQR